MSSAGASASCRKKIFSPGISSISAGSCPRLRMWKLSRQTPRLGRSALLHDTPCMPVVIDEPSPRQRLVGDADPALRGEVGEPAELVGDQIIVVDRGGAGVAAQQDEIGAEALHDIELGFGTPQVVGERVLVDALHVTERLIHVDAQAQALAEGADLLGRLICGHEIGVHDLHTVEARGCAGMELLHQATGQADRRH